MRSHRLLFLRPSSSSFCLVPHSYPRRLPLPTAVAAASPAPPVCFSTTAINPSGHNRWSKIKHDKGKADALRGANFSRLSLEIIRASRDGGPESGDMNLRLQAAIALAKKAGMTKDRINMAIERGQGRSASGAALEHVTIEAMVPGGVAMVIDCLTDSKRRALQEVRTILNQAQAQNTPTSYLFSKKGLIALTPSPSLSFDNVLETALEIPGTEDIEEPSEEGDEILVTVDPAKTGTVAAELKKRLPEITVTSSDIAWVPNEETMVDLDPDGKTASDLVALVDKLEEHHDVGEVFTNAKY